MPPDDGIGPSDQRYPLHLESGFDHDWYAICTASAATYDVLPWVDHTVKAWMGRLQLSIELTPLPRPYSHIYPNHGALTASIKVLPPEEPRLKDVEITAAACLIHLPHGPRSRRSVSRSAISERGGVAVEINDAAIQSRPAESGTPVPTAVMLSLRMPDWSVVYTGQRAFKS